MQQFALSILIGLALSLTSCLSTILGTKESRSEAYRIPKPGEGWTPIDPGDADAAYRNDADQAILNVSSVCGESRYQPLEALSSDLLRQLPAREIVAEPKSTLIGGYPALITEAQGMVDGKPLRVRIAVVRTPDCLYDFILAGPDFAPSSRLAFDRSLEGFHERSVQ